MNVFSFFMCLKYECEHDTKHKLHGQSSTSTLRQVLLLTGPVSFGLFPCLFLPSYKIVVITNSYNIWIYIGSETLT